MHTYDDCPRGVFGCAECTKACPSCGFEQPNSNAVCDICGSLLVAGDDPEWDGVSCQDANDGAGCTKAASVLLVLDASRAGVPPEPFTLFTCPKHAAAIRLDARDHKTSQVLADLPYNPRTYRN